MNAPSTSSVPTTCDRATKITNSASAARILSWDEVWASSCNVRGMIGKRSGPTRDIQTNKPSAAGIASSSAIRQPMPSRSSADTTPDADDRHELEQEPAHPAAIAKSDPDRVGP